MGTVDNGDQRSHSPSIEFQKMAAAADLHDEINKRAFIQWMNRDIFRRYVIRLMRSSR